FALGNEEVSKRFIQQIRAIFDQDIAVMEGQQRINSMLPNAPNIEIRCDVPVVAMRRLVIQASERERGEPIAVTRIDPATLRAAQPIAATQTIEVGPAPH
ncbi:MAG TPA: hypothetical protein VN656_07275, partial [Stellaceae bacterium]|nr:hypothetical protein [Stellaceae bacterium]